MIFPDYFFNLLKEAGVGLFTGVPDSLLSNLCAYVDEKSLPGEHIIAANEGNAIGLAAGYHLSSGKFACVYMQNSGLGNSVNPLTSLADPEVYRIPMLLIIGWRGEPGIKDEPQHIKQGRITEALLELLSIPYWVLDAGANPEETVRSAINKMKDIGSPVALLVRKGSFREYKSKREPAALSLLKREQALRRILELSGNSLIVATTGKTSRELFELRIEREESQRDFLTVGAMGHTLSIAMGVALGSPSKRVLCIDGDGSLLMHMGALTIAGSVGPTNLMHILLNNAAHDSVGGQPTVANQVDFSAISKASGYKAYAQASDLKGIERAWNYLCSIQGATLLEIRIALGSRKDLARPNTSPQENKLAFMNQVRGGVEQYAESLDAP